MTKNIRPTEYTTTAACSRTVYNQLTRYLVSEYNTYNIIKMVYQLNQVSKTLENRAIAVRCVSSLCLTNSFVIITTVIALKYLLNHKLIITKLHVFCAPSILMFCHMA